MLNEEYLEKLETIVSDGKDAKSLLDKYYELTKRAEELQYLIGDDTSSICKSVYRLTFNNGYGDTSVKFDDSEYAAQGVKRILEHELEITKEKLNELNVRI